MAGGRPTAYSGEVVKAAREYLENYQTEYDHPFPSVVGLCKVLNRGKSTLYDWAKDESKEFSDILDTCNEIQQMVLLHKGITGEFNSNITKLVLGKHGYHDKQETDLTSKGEAIAPVYIGVKSDGRRRDSD